MRCDAMCSAVPVVIGAGGARVRRAISVCVFLRVCVCVLNLWALQEEEPRMEETPPRIVGGLASVLVLLACLEAAGAVTCAPGQTQ